MSIGLAFATLVSALIALHLWRLLRERARADRIRTFPLPRGLFDELRRTYPHLSPKDCQLVAHGLRQFFLAYLKGGRRFVSMPSQVADVLWHAFILNTRAYDAFCRQCFGGFLHHTPAVALATQPGQRNTGLRRCWWQTCREENIDPRRPSRLPLLFALDSKLAIADGFHYRADCSGLRRDADSGAIHCGGDFSSSSVDGSTDGFGAGDGSGSDGSSGDGGGCGGGGCGGGD